MKKIVYFIIIISIFISLNAGEKIGYVDINNVFKEYRGMEDLNKRINDEIKKWENKLTLMKKDITELEKTFDREAPMLSEEAKIRKRDEINKKKQEMDAFIEEIWGENGKAGQINKQMIQPIIEKINDIILKLAKEDNYSFIIDINSVGVIYMDPSLDLTQRVIDELNKEFFIPVKVLIKYIVFDLIAKDKEIRNEQYHMKLASQLYQQLKKINEREPIDIREVNNAIKSRGYTSVEEMSTMDAINISSELGADYAIIGELSMAGNRIVIDLKVLNIKTRMVEEQIHEEAIGDIEFNDAVSKIIEKIQKIFKE